MDGTLVVLSPPASTTATGPLASFYQPQSSGTSLALVHLLDRPLTLPGAVPGIATPGYRLDAPGMQVIPGRLTFTISGADSTANGLWAVDGDASAMTRLNSLPSSLAADAVWVPDNSGLLFILSGSSQAAGNILYVAANGSQPFSLVSWLGSRIADFHWVNP
jgi:hypothetical protein